MTWVDGAQMRRTEQTNIWNAAMLISCCPPLPAVARAPEREGMPPAGVPSPGLGRGLGLSVPRG